MRRCLQHQRHGTATWTLQPEDPAEGSFERRRQMRLQQSYVQLQGGVGVHLSVAFLFS